VTPELAEAVATLERGGIVCLPTETYYGLAVDALSHVAVDRLAALKGREGKAMATIVPHLEAARRLWAAVSPQLEALALRHWPGPLTIVAPARPEVPRALVGPSGGVGARVSSHALAHAVATAFARPITATSANQPGAAPARTVAEARAQLGALVDYYLDGGEAPGGDPSTIVDEDPGGALRVIRRGPVAIPQEPQEPQEP